MVLVECVACLVQKRVTIYDYSQDPVCKACCMPMLRKKMEPKK